MNTVKGYKTGADPVRYAHWMMHELVAARKRIEELEPCQRHMEMARREAGCPDDETLVIHCRQLRERIAELEAILHDIVDAWVNESDMSAEMQCAQQTLGIQEDSDATQ